VDTIMILYILMLKSLERRRQDRGIRGASSAAGYLVWTWI